MRLTEEAMEEFQALCEQECGEAILFEEAASEREEPKPQDDRQRELH